jgi:predicted DNA-binding transcriptional regulator YafY
MTPFEEALRLFEYRSKVYREEMELLDRLLGRYPLFRRGTVTASARELGVHPSTICRDIKALLRLGRPCQHCGAFPPIGPDPGGEDGEELDSSAADPVQ